MKKMNFKGRAKQAGFTLIELIVVIVILGIMAATALPKFLDLGGDARLAKAQAGLAAVKSVVAMAQGAAQVKNAGVSTTITMGGQNYTLAGGYPKAADILAMAGLSDDYTDIEEDPAVAKTVVVATDTEHPACGFTFTEAVVDDNGTASDTSDDTVTTQGSVSGAPTLANCK